MTHEFDAALDLKELSDGVYAAQTRESYSNKPGMFGGLSCAWAAHAVAQHVDARGQVLSISATFMAAITSPDIRVEARRLTRRRQTDFWRAEIFQTGESGYSLAVAADIVMGQPRDHALEHHPRFPDITETDKSFPMRPNPMAPNWIGLYDQVFISGRPFRAGEHARSIVKIRDGADRPLDMLSLLAMADSSLPRPFFLMNGFGMASTMSLSTYVYAREDDLAKVGTDYIYLDVDSAAVANRSYDQRTTIWSADKKVLATSYQSGVFRPAK